MTLYRNSFPNKQILSWISWFYIQTAWWHTIKWTLPIQSLLHENYLTCYIISVSSGKVQLLLHNLGSNWRHWKITIFHNCLLIILCPWSLYLLHPGWQKQFVVEWEHCCLQCNLSKVKHVRQFKWKLAWMKDLITLS